MIENREKKKQTRTIRETKKRYKEKDQEIKEDKKQTQGLQNLLPKCQKIKVKN